MFDEAGEINMKIPHGDLFVPPHPEMGVFVYIRESHSARPELNLRSHIRVIAPGSFRESHFAAGLECVFAFGPAERIRKAVRGAIGPASDPTFIRSQKDVVRE